MPSAFAEGKQGLLAYDGKKIAIYELFEYEDGFKEVWHDDDWVQGYTQFLQFYDCERPMNSKDGGGHTHNCSEEHPERVTTRLLAYNPNGYVTIYKIKDGGEGLEELFNTYLGDAIVYTAVLI